MKIPIPIGSVTVKPCEIVTCEQSYVMIDQDRAILDRIENPKDLNDALLAVKTETAIREMVENLQRRDFIRALFGGGA